MGVGGWEVGPKDLTADVLEPWCGLHQTTILHLTRIMLLEYTACQRRGLRLEVRKENSPFILKLSGIPSCQNKSKEKEEITVIISHEITQSCFHLAELVKSL